MGRFSKLERGEIPPRLAQRRKKDITELAAPTTEVYDIGYYIHRGDEFYFYGDFKNALRFYSRALQQDSSNVYPWAGQIYCLIELNQIKEADIWVKRSLESFPEDVKVISLQALVFAYKGMTRRAVASSDYALSKGASELAWITRGEVLLFANNKNAHFCFEKAMERIKPDDWQTPMRIGLVYFKHKSYSNALKYLNKACAINIENYYLWYHIGRCYQFLGFAQKAIDSFNQALSHNPDYKPAEKGLAQVTHSFFLIRLLRRLTQPLKK